MQPHPILARAALARPWEIDKVFDTMVVWAGHGNSISLDRLCRALGLPGKGYMDGSKVWAAVRDGRIADVIAYCPEGVRKVRDVHRRMTFKMPPPSAIATPTPAPPQASASRVHATLNF